MTKLTSTSAKIFARMRLLALTALFCTVLALFVMLIESALPGNESAQQSMSLAEHIKQHVNVNDNDNLQATKKLRISSDDGYNEMSYLVSVVPLPLGATDDEVTYASSDESVFTVSEDGMVTYHSMGEATLTVTLKSNRAVKAKLKLRSFGTYPKDITELSSDKTALAQGVAVPLELKDQNGDLVSGEPFDIQIEDETVLTITDDMLVPKKAGATSATFRFERFSQTLEFSVKENPDFVLPERFVIKEERLTLHPEDEIDLADHVLSAEPEGAPSTFWGEATSLDGKRTLVKKSATIFEANELGSAQITIISDYNPECVSVLDIIVEEDVPTVLHIIGRDRILLDETYIYRAFSDSSYVYDVSWSVLDGNKRVRLSADGTLKAKNLGEFTLRVTSNANPEVYADMTVTISLYQSFQLFVRKLIGHFGLFAVIGFGLAFSFFMLTKPRKLYAPLTLATGALAALLSETLQLPVFTTGRVFAWKDVIVDTLGVILGLIVASLCFLIYHLIRRRTKTAEEAKMAFAKLTIKTAFTPHAKLDAMFEADAADASAATARDDTHKLVQEDVTEKAEEDAHVSVQADGAENAQDDTHESAEEDANEHEDIPETPSEQDIPENGEDA